MVSIVRPLSDTIEAFKVGSEADKAIRGVELGWLVQVTYVTVIVSFVEFRRILSDAWYAV